MIGKDEILAIVLKHLSGQHDQASHGRRGKAGYSGTIEFSDRTGNAIAVSRGDKILVNKDKFTPLSDETKRRIITHEIVHSTVDEWIDKNYVDEYPKASNALLVKQGVNSTGHPWFLFIGGNTKLSESVADVISKYVYDGDRTSFNDQFGKQIPTSKWKPWADDVIMRSGYDPVKIRKQANDFVDSLEK